MCPALGIVTSVKSLSIHFQISLRPDGQGAALWAETKEYLGLHPVAFVAPFSCLIRLLPRLVQPDDPVQRLAQVRERPPRLKGLQAFVTAQQPPPRRAPLQFASPALWSPSTQARAVSFPTR